MEPPEDIYFKNEMIIHSSVNSLYKIWRKMIYMPQIFDFLENVLYLQGNQYRCTAKIQDGKERLIWDVAVTERAGSDIHWHSENNADILHEGHVHLVSRDNRKTEMHVSLHFFFPNLEGCRSEILGNDFEQRVIYDLERFKSAVEANKFPLDPKDKEGIPEGYSGKTPPPYSF